MKRQIGIITICLGMALVLLGAFLKVNGAISKTAADVVLISGMVAGVVAFILLLTSGNQKRSDA